MEMGRVDTRIQVVQFAEAGRHCSDGKDFLDKPGFSLSITPIHPESKGSIRIFEGKVAVDPTYLSDKRDMDILKLSLTYCLKLLRSDPIDRFVQEIVSEKLMEDDPAEIHQ